LTQSIPIALLSGFAFQFFGGFYSNSEHPDIVRAYAWLPWLFYASYIHFKQSRLETRNWLLPLIVYCFITGTYQGNLFSQLAFLLGILSLQFFQARNRIHAVRLHIQIFLFIGLGILLSSIYLLPTAMNKHFMTRSVEFGLIEKFNWTPRFWPTLFMGWSNDRFNVDISMISGFITVPIICLYGLLSLDSLRKYWIWFLALILSFALAAGSSSPLYNLLVRLIPVFSYSRFPTSDYRGLVGFSAIIGGALLLKDFLQNTSRKRLLLRLTSVPLLVVMGFVTQFFPVAYIARENISAALIALLTISALYLLRQRGNWMLASLMGLTLVSGFYTLNCISWDTWDFRGSLENWYRSAYHINTQESLPVAERLHHPSLSRPPRVDVPDFDWKGFLTGDYTFQMVHYNLQQRVALTQHPALLDYMRRAWTPIFVSNLEDMDCSSALPTKPLPNILVQQTSYGMNEIHYSIRAESDFIFIENELSFPGWTAQTSMSQEPMSAKVVCGGLRAWQLPRGNYDLVARFKIPSFYLSLGVSAFFLFIYLGLIIYNAHKNSYEV